MPAPVVVRPNTLTCCLNGNLSEVELALDFVQKSVPGHKPYAELCASVEGLESMGPSLMDEQVKKVVKEHFLTVNAALNVRGMTLKDLFSALGPCNFQLLSSLAERAVMSLTHRHFDGFMESKEYRRLSHTRNMLRNQVGAAMQGENMAMIGLTKATTFASTFGDIVGWGVAAHRAVLSYLTFGNRGNKEIARTREELQLDSALFEFVVDAHRLACARSDAAMPKAMRRVVEKHMSNRIGTGVGDIPLRELLRGSVGDMPLLRCIRHSMALACGSKAGSEFDNSEYGIVAATRSTFAPFLAVAVRTLLSSPPDAASASNRARPSGKSPHCAEPEQLDHLGAEFPLGVPIPIGDHVKMRWRTGEWKQAFFWIVGGSLAWSPDGQEFAPRGAMFLKEASIVRVGVAVLGEATCEQRGGAEGSQSAGGGLGEATSEQSGGGVTKGFGALGEATSEKQGGGGAESGSEHSAGNQPLYSAKMEGGGAESGSEHSAGNQPLDSAKMEGGGAESGSEHSAGNQPLDSAKMEGGGGEEGRVGEGGGATQERGGGEEAHAILTVLSRGGGCVMIGVSTQAADGVESILRWGIRRAAWGGEVGGLWWPGGRCWNAVGGFREVSKEKEGRKWHAGEWSIQDGHLTGGRNSEENCRVDGGGEDGDVLIRKHAPQLKDMPFTLEVVAKRNLSMHYRFRSPWELDSFRIGVAGRRPSPLCLKILLPQVVQGIESGKIKHDDMGQVGIGKNSSLASALKQGMRLGSSGKGGDVDKAGGAWPRDLVLSQIKQVREDGVVYSARKPGAGDCAVVAWRVGSPAFTPRRAGEIFAQRVLLGLIKHPFIQRMHGCWHTAGPQGSEGTLYMMVGNYQCTLSERLEKAGGRVTERAARVIAAELILAIETVHMVDIVHRDITPSNVLLDQDGHVQLTGWGLCSPDVNEERRSQELVGTPDYQAPEMVAGDGWYGKEVDWWSLGVIIYEMMHGEGTFMGRNVGGVYKKVRTEDPYFGNEISVDCLQMLKGLLQRNPTERLGCNKLGGAATIKAQMWFAQHGVKWDVVVRKRVLSPLALSRLGEAPPSLSASPGGVGVSVFDTKTSVPSPNPVSPSKSSPRKKTRPEDAGRGASPPPPQRCVRGKIDEAGLMALERGLDERARGGLGPEEGGEGRACQVKGTVVRMWETLGAVVKQDKEDEEGSYWERLRRKKDRR